MNLKKQKTIKSEQNICIHRASEFYALAIWMLCVDLKASVMQLIWQ